MSSPDRTYKGIYLSELFYNVTVLVGICFLCVSIQLHILPDLWQSKSEATKNSRVQGENFWQERVYKVTDYYKACSHNIHCNKSIVMCHAIYVSRHETGQASTT